MAAEKSFTIYGLPEPTIVNRPVNENDGKLYFKGFKIVVLDFL